jgi:hypothetical protein
MYQGEPNVKGILLFQLATAHTEALLNGSPVEQAMGIAACYSLVECEVIFADMSTSLMSSIIADNSGLKTWYSTVQPRDL